MYEVGDFIYYGGTGVCRVKNIAKRKFPGERESRLFYTIEPLNEEYVIHTPVGGTKVFMRSVISKEEAESLIDTIPSIQVEPCCNKVVNQLTAHYKASLETHDCADLVALIKSVHKKKKMAEDQKRKLGAVDERFMKYAEELLFSELSVALDVPKDEVPAYISSRIAAQQDRKGIKRNCAFS